MLLVVAGLLVAQAQDLSRPPQPLDEARRSFDSYFGVGDYPPNVWRSGIEGTAGVRLDVGTDGRVTNCAIEASSGNAGLDRATCQVLRERAVHSPARDSMGRATTGSIQGIVHWRLYPDAPCPGCRPPIRVAFPVPGISFSAPGEPPVGGTVRYRAMVDAGGRIVECVIVASSGHRSVDDRTCALVRARAVYQPALDAAGRPMAGAAEGVFHWQTMWSGPPPIRPGLGPFPARRVPDDLGYYFRAEDYPAEALAAGHEGPVTYRVTVGVTGRVSSCIVTRSSGSASLDAATCRILRERGRYQPARDIEGEYIEGMEMGTYTWRLPAHLAPPPQPEPQAPR